MVQQSWEVTGQAAPGKDKQVAIVGIIHAIPVNEQGNGFIFPVLFQRHGVVLQLLAPVAAICFQNSAHWPSPKPKSLETTSG